MYSDASIAQEHVYLVFPVSQHDQCGPLFIQDDFPIVDPILPLNI
jgi:hypothetical protein